jgi:hypothetical protein
MCHTRVMPDGSTIKAAQGNLPVDRMGAYQLRRGTTPIEEERSAYRFFFAAPWLKPDPQARLDTMTREELAALGEAEPPGVCARTAPARSFRLTCRTSSASRTAATSTRPGFSRTAPSSI